MNDGDKKSGDFWALRDFLRGYFHQDCIEEYGSLEGAAREFVMRAGQAERQAVASEWKKFMDLMEESSTEKINQALHQMGSACEFSQVAEIRKVTEAFR
jgi:hypothetical protein